jgi:hypothetical protein
MRHEGEPCLEDDRNYTRPIKDQALGEMHLHIMPVNVVYNEGECVQERKDEESVSDPSVEHLEPLMRHSCK